MMLNRRALLSGTGATVVAGRANAAAAPPLVLAAASLQESLTAAADVWASKGHARPVLSFAASSALARQVAAGAPADLFISADEPWMNDLQRRGLIVPQSRAAFLGNRLVLIGSKGTRRNAAGLAAQIGSQRLALADPDSVPAGRYAKAALERLGLWARIQGNVVRGESVRAALAFVERGAAPLGIVYATDARASTRVRVVAVFPAGSHPPIRYPLAILKASAHPDAAAFRAFLLSSRGKAIFRRYGFAV